MQPEMKKTLKIISCLFNLRYTHPYAYNRYIPTRVRQEAGDIVKIAKVAKIVGSLALIASITACVPASNYTGTVTVKNAIASKASCTVNAELEDGTSKTLNLGPSLNCLGLSSGETINLENGKVVK